ncbi:peptidoglycan recognition protein family protein [Actinokineospora iranica]|uniref:N-acetylmuramoyl-L-alanine amidase n=1 Tax=Actinokineospora iranica TaxID=1271860 RepID=A0A1G6XZT4_9PSEU|nr:N-acetylmuramoyl-L-alanine amidase [Actinokineospora iranica]SDD83541.1 N-acetylmuramoyl-L-alanine amidase [Actinokineospora iranica]
MALTRRALLRTGVTVGLAGASLPALTGPAHASPAVPVIATCVDWGARPAAAPVEMLDRKPTYIVVHHTATENSDDFSLEHAYALARHIQNLHMDTRGWIDSGQQLTNSRGGHLAEGRHRSLEALGHGTKHVLGAHVANHNSAAIGIENEGTYTDLDVPAPLWDSLVGLVAYIARQYGIAPAEIRGHRDFNTTECPGNILYARLPELRQAVADQLGQTVAPRETWPLLRPGDTGPRVLAAQYLLRDRGKTVTPDGVFGEETAAAMRELSVQAGLPHDPCYASRQADERHLIGAGAWPALIRPVDLADGSEAAKAARALTAGRAGRVEARDWPGLLAR